MTSRYIVIQPGMNDLATQVSDQLATLLEARGGFTMKWQLGHVPWGV